MLTSPNPLWPRISALERKRIWRQQTERAFQQYQHDFQTLPVMEVNKCLEILHLDVLERIWIL